MHRQPLEIKDVFIEVEAKSNCELKREVWRFSTHAFPHLCLTEYRAETRATRRHKWVGVGWDTYKREWENKYGKPFGIPKHVIEGARKKLEVFINSANVYIGASPEDKNKLVDL